MTLKLHHLRPAPGAKKAKTRKGRGDASKGTRARNTVRAGFEGGQLPLVMRLPKLRGFKNPARIEYQAVNVSTINALFPKGGDVTVADLIAKGAVRDSLPVKVLGNGEIDVKVSVTAHAFSSSAVDKITAAGGTTNVL
jgi:large subunit ribosomal protein L15